MKPRILIFSLAYFPFVGGAEVALKEITDRLPSYEFDLVTVNLDGKQKSTEKIGNTTIYRIGRGRWSKYFFPLTAFLKAIKLHRQNAYSLIWSMMANQAGLAALFFKLRFPKVPHVLSLQEGDSNRSIFWRTLLIKPLYKAIYTRADHIQAISSFLIARAKYYAPKAIVTLVPNGVSELFFMHDTPAATEPVIVSSSRLVKKNGLDILVRALSLLPSVKLKIAGSGVELSALQTLAEELKVRERLEFVGHVDPTELPAFVKQGAVFVRPSRSEGLGNSFLEAMAVGLPVIGTPVGGIPDIVKEGVTGWLAGPEDPRDLAEKIKFILDPMNHDTVRRVVANAKQMAQEHYRWELIAGKMDDIFKQYVRS